MSTNTLRPQSYALQWGLTLGNKNFLKNVFSLKSSLLIGYCYVLLTFLFCCQIIFPTTKNQNTVSVNILLGQFQNCFSESWDHYVRLFRSGKRTRWQKLRGNALKLERTLIAKWQILQGVGCLVSPSPILLKKKSEPVTCTQENREKAFSFRLTKTSSGIWSKIRLYTLLS